MPTPDDGGSTPFRPRRPRWILSGVSAWTQPKPHRTDPSRPPVRVAEEDPALLGALTGELADTARHQLVARTVWVEAAAKARMQVS